MSTRASAPRCASCGMPLAPGATSCAVCGARVPLIARTTAGAADAPAPAWTAAGVDVTAPRQDAPAGAEPSHVGPGSRDLGTTGPDPSGRGPRPAVPPVPPGSAASSGTGSGPSAVLPPAPPSAPAASASAAPQRRVDATAAARAVRAAGRPAGDGAVPRGAAAPPAVGRRVAAYAIDLALAFVVGLVGYLLSAATGLSVSAVTVVLGALVGVGQIVAEGLHGATLGAHLLGLRTVDDRTGAAPGVPRAFLRQLVVALGMPVCLVGNWVVVASAAWDRDTARRGWHDKASGTRVVRAGASPVAAPSGSTAAAYRMPSGASRPGPVQGGGAVPAADALYAPPPAPDRRGPVPPPPVGPVAPPPPAPAPDLVADAPRSPRSADRPERPAADLLPPPPTVGRGPGAAPAAQPPVARPPAVPESFGMTADDDLAELEHTRVRHPDSLRRRTGTLALSFDTGERVRVVGRGLVGRGPRAEDGEDILHVVALQDAGRSLSRVHAEFGPQEAEAGQDAAIWVADRGSTNGTVVVDPDGVARVLPAGTPAVVRAGWTVRLGDREVRVEDD